MKSFYAILFLISVYLLNLNRFSASLTGETTKAPRLAKKGFDEVFWVEFQKAGGSIGETTPKTGSLESETTTKIDHLVEETAKGAGPLEGETTPKTAQILGETTKKAPRLAKKGFDDVFWVQFQKAVGSTGESTPKTGSLESETTTKIDHLVGATTTRAGPLEEETTPLNVNSLSASLTGETTMVPRLVKKQFDDIFLPIRRAIKLSAETILKVGSLDGDTTRNVGQLVGETTPKVGALKSVKKTKSGQLVGETADVPRVMKQEDPFNPTRFFPPFF